MFYSNDIQNTNSTLAQIVAVVRILHTPPHPSIPPSIQKIIRHLTSTTHTQIKVAVNPLMKVSFFIVEFAGLWTQNILVILIKFLCEPLGDYGHAMQV